MDFRMNFKNKTALVTGAAVGIGRAVAMKLAEGGANLVLMDANGEKLANVKNELQPYGVEIETFACDISNEAQVHDMVQAAVGRFGKIDILVNNAAIWRCWAPFTETSIEDWKRFLDINVMGVVYATKEILPLMIENGYGRIVNVASVAGVYGNANMVHYSATKGALIAMTKALAKEVATKGVTVNCTSPGSVSPSSNPDPNYYQESSLPFMGRSGTDMENANLICFLASEEAAYISGQNIQIDGCRKKL